jgi:hypothetical protein
VLSITNDGMIAEQEFLQGESLEELGNTQGGSEHLVGRISQEIQQQVLKDWRSSKDLIRDTGIWMDLKSANYIYSQGKIVNVDYVPRLNDTKWRYFQKMVEVPSQTLAEETKPGTRRSKNKFLFEKPETKLENLEEDEFLELFFFYDIKNREKELKKKAEEELNSKRAKDFLYGVKPSNSGLPTQTDKK